MVSFLAELPLVSDLLINQLVCRTGINICGLNPIKLLVITDGSQCRVPVELLQEPL